MNKEQRQPYRELIDLIPGGYGLCNFCQYAEWEGWSYCEASLDCKHPLTDVIGFVDPEDAWSGSDCWGFRPSETLQEIGVAVGIMLEGNMAHKSQRYGGYIAIIPSERDKAEGLVGSFV